MPDTLEGNPVPLPREALRGYLEALANAYAASLDEAEVRRVLGPCAAGDLAALAGFAALGEDLLALAEWRSARIMESKGGGAGGWWMILHRLQALGG